jgi:hypothetical protein
MTSRDASTRRATGSSAAQQDSGQQSQRNDRAGRARGSGVRPVKRGTFRDAGKLNVALWSDERFLALPGTAQRACLYLASRRANPDGEGWPRMKDLANALRCERSTAQRAVRDAEQAGLLEVVEWEHHESGQQMSNLYRFDRALLGDEGRQETEDDDDGAW